jgi:hypothetical protein
MSRSNVLVVGDVGTVIYVQILDQRTGDAQADGAATVTAEVTRPDGTEATITLEPSEDAADHPAAEGWWQHQTDDEFTGETAGALLLRPRYTLAADESWRAARDVVIPVVD